MNLARLGLSIPDPSSGDLRFDCDTPSSKCTTCAKSGMRCTLQAKGKWDFEFNSVKRDLPKEERIDEDESSNMSTSMIESSTVASSCQNNNRRSSSAVSPHSITHDISINEVEKDEDDNAIDWKAYFTPPAKAAAILDMDDSSSHLARGSDPTPDNLSRRSSGYSLSHHRLHIHATIDSVISGISNIFGNHYQHHGSSTAGSSASTSRSHSRRTSWTSVHGMSPSMSKRSSVVSKRSSVAAPVSISRVEEN